VFGVGGTGVVGGYTPYCFKMKLVSFSFSFLRLVLSKSLLDAGHWMPLAREIRLQSTELSKKYTLDIPITSLLLTFVSIPSPFP
jgi:hypothetical protein